MKKRLHIRIRQLAYGVDFGNMLLSVRVCVSENSTHKLQLASSAATTSKAKLSKKKLKDEKYNYFKIK